MSKKPSSTPVTPSNPTSPAYSTSTATATGSGGASVAAKFRTSPRSDAERTAIAANVLAHERQALSPNDREKLHVAAILSLPTKFGLLSMSDDAAQLQNNYNVTMRIHEFLTKLTKFDMQEQFVSIVTPDPANPSVTIPKTINVIEEYTKLCIEEVQHSNKYYNDYGPQHMVQNLVWLQELLENSCEPALRDKVTSNCCLFCKINKVGPFSS